MALSDKKRMQRRDAQQRRRDRWRAAGLCITCGGGPGPSCTPCLKKQRIRNQKRAADRRATGCCYRCNDKLDPTLSSVEVKYPQCLSCFTRSTADHHLGTRDRGHELAAIFLKQDGRCRYTGEKLVLGDTASLDHIVPKSRGGTDEIENLQWVTARVNKCKDNLNHEEWVSLCKKVSSSC